MSIDSEIPNKAKSPGEAPSLGDSEKKLPESWIEALACLVSSRIAIAQAESKEAATAGAQKAALGVIAAFCGLLTWILVLAGAVGAISASTPWAWYHVAFAAACLHLAVALIAVLKMAKTKAIPSFPITRAEFEKDREWLKQLKKSK